VIATEVRTPAHAAASAGPADAASRPAVGPLAALADAGLEVPVLGGRTVRHVNLVLRAGEQRPRLQTGETPGESH